MDQSTSNPSLMKALKIFFKFVLIGTMLLVIFNIIRFISSDAAAQTALFGLVISPVRIKKLTRFFWFLLEFAMLMVCFGLMISVDTEGDISIENIFMFVRSFPSLTALVITLFLITAFSIELAINAEEEKMEERRNPAFPLFTHPATCDSSGKLCEKKSGKSEGVLNYGVCPCGSYRQARI